MIADPLWSCVLLLCGLLWVLCGPLRYLVIPLFLSCFEFGHLSSIICSGVIRAFIVSEHIHCAGLCGFVVNFSFITTGNGLVLPFQFEECLLLISAKTYLRQQDLDR